MAIIIGYVSLLTSYSCTKASIEKVLEETVETTSKRVDHRLEIYRGIATEISAKETFVYMTGNEHEENKQKMI